MAADFKFGTGGGRAIRILATLYRRAEKQNAVVELDQEDEFKVHRLKFKLGTLLDQGRHVSIVPAIPFEEGGLFHPSNLTIARSNPCEDDHHP
jgi:hypothetical protein